MADCQESASGGAGLALGTWGGGARASVRKGLLALCASPPYSDRRVHRAEQTESRAPRRGEAGAAEPGSQTWEAGRCAGSEPGDGGGAQRCVGVGVADVCGMG